MREHDVHVGLRIAVEAVVFWYQISEEFMVSLAGRLVRGNQKLFEHEKQILKDINDKLSK